MRFHRFRENLVPKIHVVMFSILINMLYVIIDDNELPIRVTSKFC